MPGSFSPLATPFRLFFLAAGLLAALVVPAWIALLLRGTQLIDSHLGPLFWHAHEMLFGFTGAVLAGFLLTAARNWTGQPTLSGGPLAGLLLLWLAGRVLAARGALAPPWAGALVDAAFFAATAAALVRALIPGRNWRNLPLAILVALLGACDAILHLALHGDLPPAALPRALEVGVDTVALIILMFGGRVVPMFTRNATGFPARAMGRRDQAGILAMLAALLADAIAPQHPAAHALAIAAGVLNLARLAGWGGSRTLRTPLLWVLHAGWLLLALGLVASGLAGLTTHVPPAAARHLLTVGGIGMMTLGMMARVALGHTGRMLIVPRPVAIAFGLLLVAAAARVAAAIAPRHQIPLLWLAAGAWGLAFAAFALRYAGILLSPRVDGKPG
jgi:uncharacterized protein involved in response to NO